MCIFELLQANLSCLLLDFFPQGLKKNGELHLLTFLRIIRIVFAKQLCNRRLAKMRLAIYLEEGYRKSF